MAKTDLTLADLIAGQEKSSAQMSSFIKKQLDTQLSAEKIAKESEKIESASLKSLTDKSGDGLNSNIIKMKNTIEKTNTLLERNEIAKEVLDKVGDRREFKTIGQRVGGVKENVKDFFTMRGFLDKTGIVKRGSGGMFSEALDAREDRQKYAQARISAGDPTTRLHSEEGARKIFERQRGEQQELVRQKNKLEGDISKYRDLNISEKTIESSPEQKALMELAPKFERVDPSVRVEREDGTSLEESIEQKAIQEKQSDLLEQIEENTRATSEGELSVSSDEGSGGGILSGVGAGLAVLGKGVGQLGKGVGQGIKGILVGLAQGIVALGTAVASGVGAIGLASLAGIILAIAAAIRIAAPGIKEFAPVLMKLAEQIGIVAAVIGDVFIEAIKTLPEIISSVSQGIATIVESISGAIIGTIDAVTNSIERLAQIDGSNLLSVGAGLVAVAGGMAAFGAAQAVAGASNLVSNILSVGQDNPMEQLEKISKFGPNLEKAGSGVKNLARGLTEFSSIDPKSIKAISALPVEKIAAMGAIMNNANTVYSNSSNNAQAALPERNKEQTNVVSAPTTNIKQTKNVVVKQATRNPESSLNQYLKTRYAL
jgi:hypothetical protein